MEQNYSETSNSCKADDDAMLIEHIGDDYELFTLDCILKVTFSKDFREDDQML